MVGDRVRQAVAAQEERDLRALALDRRQRRRVVHEDDPEVAAGGRAQAGVERFDLLAGLGVHPAQERLAEVGQVRAREAADEALGADDPKAGAADLAGGVGALEQRHAPVLQHRRQLGDAIRMPVVVAEHREHGSAGLARGGCKHARLLGLAECRQVARQQHDVRLAAQARERRTQIAAARVVCVDVAGRGHPYPFSACAHRG